MGKKTLDFCFQVLVHSNYIFNAVDMQIVMGLFEIYPISLMTGLQKIAKWQRSKKHKKPKQELLKLKVGLFCKVSVLI